MDTIISKKKEKTKEEIEKEKNLYRKVSKLIKDAYNKPVLEIGGSKFVHVDPIITKMLSLRKGRATKVHMWNKQEILDVIEADEGTFDKKVMIVEFSDEQNSE